MEPAVAPAESLLQSGGMAMGGDDELMQALPLPEMLSMPTIKHEVPPPSQAVNPLAGCINQAAPPVPVLAGLRFVCLQCSANVPCARPSI